MELFAVQQCSREIPFAIMFHLGFKSALQLTPKNSTYLSLKQLKMLKFTIALLFAQVLLAAPLPQPADGDNSGDDTAISMPVEGDKQPWWCPPHWAGGHTISHKCG